MLCCCCLVDEVLKQPWCKPCNQKLWQVTIDNFLERTCVFLGSSLTLLHIFLGRPISFLITGGLISTWSSRGHNYGPLVGKIMWVCLLKSSLPAERMTIINTHFMHKMTISITHFMTITNTHFMTQTCNILRHILMVVSCFFICKLWHDNMGFQLKSHFLQAHVSCFRLTRYVLFPFVTLYMDKSSSPCYVGIQF